MPQGADVVAAGAVITRHGGSEVLLIHRPKYDDWSFPKGKQDAGEHLLRTATREVLEETGLRVHLGRPLPSQWFEISGGRSKVVNYWVARLAPDDRAASAFTPNSEVDECAWLPLAEAEARLSYADDVDLLASFRQQTRRTRALVVVRHASAEKRSSWSGSDRTRPLDERGLRQAEALVPLLSSFGVSALHTSPSLRCAMTLAPYAQQTGATMAHNPTLSEEDTTQPALREFVTSLLGASSSAAVCSHRPVLPAIFDALGTPEEPLAPAEFVVVHHRQRSVVAVERYLSV